METLEEPRQATAPGPSLWSRVRDRRVPQIIGLYVGGATSAVLFAEFLVTRYALSPYLVDVLLAGLALALPGVAVLAYSHGAPGAQRWSWRQLVTLAANALVAVGVLAASFWGAPLGATTESVTVETADGETVQRTVAKAAFRKRVVVADFGGDADLGRAAGYALATDLGQDLFVSAMSAGSLRRGVREAGFTTTAGAPAALLREAADRAGADGLVVGRVERTGPGVRVEAELHGVSGPGRPDLYALEGPSLPRLLDDLSARIRTDLGLPEVHLAETDDRLVEDILTASTPALVAWAAGLHAGQFLDDPEAALGRFEAAVAEDSTFAAAHVQRAGALFRFARQAEGEGALAAATRHRYRLPEAHRFALDISSALFDQRPEDALAITREWAALYPDDVQAHETLVGRLQQDDNLDGAIEAARTLLEVDSGNPERRQQLAGLLYAAERYDEALEEVDAFLAAEPDNALGYASLAAIQQVRGDLDAALEANRRAIRLEPSDARHRLRLGSMLMSVGEWDEAERTLRAVASEAAEPSDHAGALNQLAHLYDAQGRYREAAETLDVVWATASAYTPEVRLLTSRLGEGYHYTRAGRTDVFEQTLRETLSRPEVRESEAYRASTSASAAWAYAQTGRTDEVFRYAAAADSLYRAFGAESSRPFVQALRGIGHLNRGDWRRAVADLRPYAEDNPADYFRVLPLAEAHLAAGDEAEARAVAEGLLVAFPALPHAHLILAKLDRRRPEAARRHLRAALAAWADADANFEPAQEARALLARLGT